MRFILPALLLLAAAPQDDVRLKWGVGADEAADYDVFVRGKTPDRSFVIFGSELVGHTNRLYITDYRDLAFHLMFRLPEEPVRKGSKWTFQQDFFPFGINPEVKGFAFKPIRMQGLLRVKKIEKLDEIECHRIDAIYNYMEMKPGGKVSGRPMGQLAITQWFDAKAGLLRKAVYTYKGKRQTFPEIRQGIDFKMTGKKLSEQIVLKPELIKVEALATREFIEGAIDQGVAWLRKQQQRNGSFVDKSGSFARDFPGGSTGLCTMALLHSGVKPDDPAVTLACRFMRKQGFRRIYDVSMMVMAFEAKYLPPDRSTGAKVRDAVEKSISREDRAFVENAAKWLISQQEKNGAWGYPKGSEGADHSNTQYAMLALKSASRCGVKIPYTVWKKAADHFVKFQKVGTKKETLDLEFERKDNRGITGSGDKVDQGAWGYKAGKGDIDPMDDGDIPEDDPTDSFGYGSMTCAGLTSLLIAESELLRSKNLPKNRREAIERAKQRGLAWLQGNYSVRGNPPASGIWSLFYFYYLYSLERVGVLYGIRKIGGHDWYQEGAMILVRSQRKDGSWLDFDGIPEVDTAFALLFLKRATIPVATESAGRK